MTGPTTRHPRRRARAAARASGPAGAGLAGPAAGPDSGPVAGPLAALAAALLAAAPAAAQDAPRWLGFALTSSNDDFFAAEILDRWRTGAVTAHGVFGTGWTPQAGVGFGEVLEFRVDASIRAPESFEDPAPGDRPYAGAVSFGVHAHGAREGLHYRVGGDLVVTGPQSQMAYLQDHLHERTGLPDVDEVADNQIGDALYLRLSGEAARPLALGRGLTLRPFAEARAGDETFARIGADMLGGSLGSGGLLVRDEATGQLVEATRGAATGFGWAAGLDIASVLASAYLPDADGYPGPGDAFARARLGAMWAGRSWSVFAGTAWLGPEFDGQEEGQMVGAVALTLGF